MGKEVMLLLILICFFLGALTMGIIVEIMDRIIERQDRQKIAKKFYRDES